MVKLKKDLKNNTGEDNSGGDIFFATMVALIIVLVIQIVTGDIHVFLNSRFDELQLGKENIGDSYNLSNYKEIIVCSEIGETEWYDCNEDGWCKSTDNIFVNRTSATCIKYHKEWVREEVIE